MPHGPPAAAAGEAGCAAPLPPPPPATARRTRTAAAADAAASVASSILQVMARLQIHPLGLFIVVFGLLAWVIALGGAGAASYNCQKSNSYAQCALEYQ